MPTLEATLILKQDGEALGDPIVSRLDVDAVLTYVAPSNTGGPYVTIGSIPTAQVVLLRPLAHALTARFDGQTDAGVTVNAGGFVFIFNATLDAGASDNVKISVPVETDVLFMEAGA